MTLTNAGIAPEPFEASAQVIESPWQTVMSKTEIGPLAPGASETLDVTVAVPASASDSQFSVAIVNVRSKSNAAQADNSVLVTTASPRPANVGTLDTTAGGLLLLSGSLLALLLLRRRLSTLRKSS
jgi:uncharacterized membrane protein